MRSVVAQATSVIPGPGGSAFKLCRSEWNGPITFYPIQCRLHLYPRIIRAKTGTEDAQLLSIVIIVGKINFEWDIIKECTGCLVRVWMKPRTKSQSASMLNDIANSVNNRGYQ